MTTVELGSDLIDPAFADSPEPAPRTDHAPTEGSPDGPDAQVAWSSPQLSDAAVQVPACRAGWADCDEDVTNGCETDLQQSASDCGVCGNACPHDDCACDRGELVPHCPAGRADCDGRLDNGCEVSLATDAAHCGSCDDECHARGAAVAAAMCEDGICVLTCKMVPLSPRADCDGDVANGCETHLWEDNDNCGKCGTHCGFCDEGECL